MKENRSWVKEVITLLLLALSALAHAQAPDTGKLNRFFDRLAENNKAMGSLVIARGGQAIYARAFGYSEIGDRVKTPLTAASRFRIGSITKMFTAVMILQLAEEGRLHLDDKLDRFFPQIPDAGRITIAQILMHRSGIHDAVLDKNLRGTPKTAPLTREELLGLIAKGVPDFAPGARHQYSNSGYIVLGFVIEKLTGQSYSDNLRERITSKLGLADTYMATGPINTARQEALTYRNIGGEWKQDAETHPSLLFSAGAIVSTPHDLARFIGALFDGKLVSRDHLAAMKTMQDGDGWGMEPFSFAGKTFYGHTGGADNYGAWVAYLPEEKLAVAYTTNAKMYPVGDIMNGIVDMYYNKPFALPVFETIIVSTGILDKYTGVYSTAAMPVKFTISRNGAKLYIQPNAESPAPLEATAQNKFTITAGVTVEFDTEKKQMILTRGGRATVFTRER